MEDHIQEIEAEGTKNLEELTTWGYENFAQYYRLGPHANIYREKTSEEIKELRDLCDKKLVGKLEKV